MNDIITDRMKEYTEKNPSLIGIGLADKLKAYQAREATFLGRLVNNAVDAARSIMDKPPLFEAAALLGRRAEAEAKASQLPTPNDPPRDFSNMISTALEASGLDAKSQFQALAMIDDAAVYLHQADPTNRSARAATPGSIGAEWNQLGLTEAQAGEMITKAIGYTQEKAHAPRADQVAERLAGEMTRASPERAEAVAQSIERETPAHAIGGR